MTTKRMSFQLQQQASHHHHQHHQHHHAQRRPPDVEEALSSMLWTPYERASTTDTSSDDDDEHLQRQLKKSKSQYDYTSVPTTIPPLTPPPPPTLPATATLPMPLPLPTPTALALPTSQIPLPPTHITPTNIVAYITTTTPLRAAAQAAVAATSLLTCTPVRKASAATATSSYYTAEDLCDPSVVTPLVPLSNFMLNAHTMTTTTSPTAANNDIDVDQGNDDDDDDDVDGDVDDDVDTIVHDINVDDTFNDVVYRNENRLAATSSSLAMMSSSYQQKNRYSSSSSSSTFSTFGRIPSLTKWWSTSSNTQSNTVSIASHYDNSNVTVSTTQLPTQQPSSASTLTDEANKQPPSYESLYNKKQHPLRSQRRPQRHSHSHYRLNKHLNLFKPVLETLKANVTTITQGRFTSLARPDNNCRVTNNATTTTTNALNHGTTTLTPILTTATTAMTIATEALGENYDNSTESTTSNNLVHSFTDNFLHEHCQTTQHVAATNVANDEHIINNNNNNNNDTLTTDNNMNGGDTPNQSHEILIHQQHTHLQESTNNKSKQNQEHENKQNNNFIISQQQQKPEQLLLTITTNENNENDTSNEQKKMNTKTKTVNEQQQQLTTDHREPTMDVFNTTTTTTNMIEESGLLYDSSSAISLTRSFEANTSYTFDCTPNNANSFNKFSYETRKTSDTSTTTATTISNTYNLTPNKCLAELERLYAEFRASESIREQKLRENQNLPQQNARRRRNLKDIATETENMRLNVPASNSANAVAEFNNRNSVGVVKAVSETKLNPSTSSVFLTTTNSLTTITNPCQRTPSLTIQVNQNQPTNSNNTNINTCNNNNNNHNNNSNNNNINNNNNDDNDVASATNTGHHDNNDLQQQMFLNQAIVNTTTNGVSVINCNYANNNNNNNNNYSNSNNNNNSNNKSITNLQDSVTNSKSISNPISSANNSNNNHDPTDHTKSNNNNHMPGGVSDNIPNSSVPQVFNASDENPSTTNSSPLKQVNVIKVNERVEKCNNSNASTPAQSPRRRTFTSTECQTDDIASVQLRSPSAGRPPLTSTLSANSTCAPHSTTNNREQRRRERRERRHLQHTASLMVAPTHHSHPHPPHPLRHASLMDRHSMPTPPLPPILHPPHLHLQQTGHHNVAMLRPMLPDILHNHFPPPYSALPPPPPPPTVGSGSVPPHHHNGSPLTFSHAPPPQTQSATATILGPPPPPPAGTTLLTSVISTVPIPGATPMVSDGRFTLPLPIMRRSPSERSGKGCCGQWFAGPPLRALIAVVALGGVACALGGAALGATGLAGPPSSHFTAALLMIGVGVVLVTVSGAAWRMTAPGGPPCLGLGSSVDLGRCGRRPCSRGGGAPQGLLYPEFQHRPPPPSYQASMQEYRLRLLLLDRDRQNGVVRGSSPPPTYRSHAGSLLRAPLTSTIRGTHGLSGGRCESSIGGSEYSFPPSYRSRNTTPGTINSERSIETEPSGRLLANEDIPEPLTVDQLSEYNSLQQRTLNTSNANSQKSEQKRNSIQLDSPDLVTKSEANLNQLNSDKKNDLVTIVTITPNSNSSDIMEVHENRNNVCNGNEGNGNEDLVRNSESREQIEILAHL